MEFICGTVSGTTVSNLERGISFDNATTTSLSRQFPHRVGANVKVTDYPLIQRMRNILSGVEGSETVIKYKSTISTSTIGASDLNLASVKYVNDVAFNGAGVVNAGETTRGVVELATQVEMSSSTISGGSGVLALQSKYATSSAPTSGRYVPVTRPNGDLAEGFIPTTLSQQYTFNSTSTFSGFISGVGASPSTTVYSTVGTTTYSVPSNLRYIHVVVVGGGGGGAGFDMDSTTCCGVPGSSGGYSERIYTKSQLGTTTVKIVVGAGGSSGTSGSTPTSGVNGNPSKFLATASVRIICGGGTAGVAADGTFKAGGSCTGGTVNIIGGQGFFVNSGAQDAYNTGGENRLGIPPRLLNGNSALFTTGSGYGYGGPGGSDSNSAGIPNAGNGVVIITPYF
jgi:hypothetical protein